MAQLRDALLGLTAALSLACSGTPQPAPQPPIDPSDDPADWPVDSTVSWQPVLEAPRFVVPGSAVAAPLGIGPSNNNVEIEFFQGRLYLAWRTSRDHWASAETTLNVVSSGDGGETWTKELEVSLGSDLREPRMARIGGRLLLMFFQGGTQPTAFEPRALWRTVCTGSGHWSPLESWGDPATVPWDLKVRGGEAWLTSYKGNHYDGGTPNIALFFERSTDALTFAPVTPEERTVYTGGVSEAAFEFDEAGDLWAVTRNEDGDRTGFGSHLCTARASDLGRWTCPEQSDPERYDSPEIFRHGSDLYLLARRDIGGPYDQGRSELSFTEQSRTYQLDYWQRPKRTALYRIDREERRIVHLTDLPGAGDTAFPSIRRTGAHTFLLANYTSPVDKPDIAWVEGQRGPTSIYLQTIRFEPKP